MKNERPKTYYTCSVCSSPATVSGEGKILRTCEHTTSGVIAHLSAHARGISSVETPKAA